MTNRRYDFKGFKFEFLKTYIRILIDKRVVSEVHSYYFVVARA